MPLTANTTFTFLLPYLSVYERCCDNGDAYSDRQQRLLSGGFTKHTDEEVVQPSGLNTFVHATEKKGETDPGGGQQGHVLLVSVGLRVQLSSHHQQQQVSCTLERDF